MAKVIKIGTRRTAYTFYFTHEEMELMGHPKELTHHFTTRGMVVGIPTIDSKRTFKMCQYDKKITVGNIFEDITGDYSIEPQTEDTFTLIKTT